MGRNVSSANNGFAHLSSYQVREPADKFGACQPMGDDQICMYENANDLVAQHSHIDPLDAEAASRLKQRSFSEITKPQLIESPEAPSVVQTAEGDSKHAAVTGIKNALNETTLKSVASSESCPQTGSSSSHRRALECQDNGAYSSGERHRRRADESLGVVASRDNRKPIGAGQQCTQRAPMMINGSQPTVIMDSEPSAAAADEARGCPTADDEPQVGEAAGGEQSLKERSNHDNTIGSAGECGANLSHTATAAVAAAATAQVDAAADGRRQHQRQRRELGSSTSSSSASAAATSKPAPLQAGSNVDQSQQRRPSCSNMSVGEQCAAELPVHLQRHQLPKRPMSNLIRRDDSWQSLVSLARLGKETPTRALPGVAQRSLYAQHIMPNQTPDESNNSAIEPNNGHRWELPLSETHRRHLINIESTVTPIRGGRLLRHQSSVQARKLRPLPPIGDRNVVSFDGASAPSPPPPAQVSQLLMLSPSQRQEQQQQQQQQQDTQRAPLSYHQKLLHLQLLHNSNNVDYIRNNGYNIDDYNQIYACDTNSNHYGYYSMRSNLKSAASEFSFIRPSYTGNVDQLPAHQQNLSQLASKPSHGSASLARRFRELPERCSQVQLDLQQSERLNCSSDGALVANVVVANSAEPHPALVDLPVAAPNRDLPLKPSKRRNAANSGVGGRKNAQTSSLTSGIVSFFRRAFSRRSRPKAKKLPESCSSSIFAFDEQHPFVSNINALPSAFSTGGKSIDQTGADEAPQQLQARQQLQQHQRMIDMVEAFKSKAKIMDERARVQQHLMSPRAQAPTQAHRLASASFYGQVPGQQVPGALLAADGRASSPNQFSSPLHKSNSVSASMGFGTLRDLVDGNRYRNLLAHEQGAHERRLSPMITRSTKVMSAHLAPGRRAGLESLDEPTTIDELAAEQSVMSPGRHRSARQACELEQPPRPSSIYGQPSLVASPVGSVHVAQTPEKRTNHGPFGLHRGSLHSQLRERVGPGAALNLTGGISIETGRRQYQQQYSHHAHPHPHQMGSQAHSHHYQHHLHQHQLKKLPCLDTTREVAEEVPSPTGTIAATPHCDRGTPPVYKHERALIAGRQAVVNPILQSPTANTIYDNHPNQALLMASHYDNGGAHFSSPAATASVASRGLLVESPRPSFKRPPPSASSHPNRESTYYVHQLQRRTQPINIAASRMTSSVDAGDVSSSTTSGGGGGGGAWIHATPLRDKRVTDMMLTYNKPAAIIAPNTPDRTRISGPPSSRRRDLRAPHSFQDDDGDGDDDDVVVETSPYQVSNVSAASVMQSSQSPMINRRLLRDEPNLGPFQAAAEYQQSSRAAPSRAPTKFEPSGVGEKYDDSGFGSGDYGRHRQGLDGQPSDSAAAGINLADVFLRGAPIEAYEVAMLQQRQQQQQQQLQHRVAATRQSQTIVAQQQQNEDSSPGRSRAASNKKQRSVDGDDGRGARRRNSNRADNRDRDTSFELSREASSSSTGSRSTATTDTRSNSNEWKVSSPRRSSDEVNKVGGGDSDYIRGSEDCKQPSSLGTNETRANQVARSHLLNGTHNAFDREGENSKGKMGTKRSSISKRARDSSTDQSVETLNSAHETILGSEPEERDWITSKLVE